LSNKHQIVIRLQTNNVLTRANTLYTKIKAINEVASKPSSSYSPKQNKQLVMHAVYPSIWIRKVVNQTTTGG